MLLVPDFPDFVCLPASQPASQPATFGLVGETNSAQVALGLIAVCDVLAGQASGDAAIVAYHCPSMGCPFGNGNAQGQHGKHEVQSTNPKPPSALTFGSEKPASTPNNGPDAVSGLSGLPTPIGPCTISADSQSLVSRNLSQL
ncbi:hypothetical protein B0T26DRAFT_432634 [Lasiosphaeria miniovina]|uniref:Uncharacterized protein n=1 Tax=Lasiosphaeria miniovina TaxID=1954250 RepID=A0AA40DNU5_9PEZI|nr:uncharacterized protein B0T26DRAFT_432634 [Lasiosphaeria miniovina]KAK0710105.1 hypothetical protein B0T26DRAFT_432634 [Lasiosphaeria miniovina]